MKSRFRIRVPAVDLFCQIAKQSLGVEVEKEYKFHLKRRWRFDYAIPAFKIALEVEGGVWTSGRHTRGGGFIGDMEKYNTATCLGWRIVRCTPDQLLTTDTLQMIKKLMTI